MAALAADHPAASGSRLARVARTDRGSAVVLGHDGPARIATDADVATGDWVLVTDDRLVAVLPRWSALVRRAAGRPQPQVLAANVDVVLLTVRSDRPFNARRLERLLALTWESAARPVVVLTKSDLVAAPDAASLAAAVGRTALGSPVIATSATGGGGLDELRASVAPGETAVLLGESGAGKSTLANALLGTHRLATGAVRDGDGKGRHTTTARELVPLGDGRVLLDTPGLRAVGLWAGGEGVERTFADVADVAAACRFGDCRHEREPGCAVAAALADGTLDADRVAAYRKLQREVEHARRQADVRLQRAAARQWGRQGRDAQRAKDARRRGRR